MYVIVEILLLLLKVACAYLEAFYRLIVPKTRKSIRGKLVLVTGGSRGIGRAIAIEFAKKGANIALWDINQSVNEQTADDIAESTGVTVKAYTCDVTKIDDVRSAAASLRRDMGSVDILVNNAGVMKCRHLLDLSEAEIRQTMEVNTVAHFWTVREFLPDMLDRKQGHIVTIASLAGLAGTPMLVDYCASKFSAVGFSLALAEEMRHDYPEADIEVSIVCPSFAATNLISDIRHRVKMINRFDDALSAEKVASDVVEGVTRNFLWILIPSHANNLRVMIGIMPRKALQAIGNFIQARFVPVDRK